MSEKDFCKRINESGTINMVTALKAFMENNRHVKTQKSKL